MCSVTFWHLIQRTFSHLPVLSHENDKSDKGGGDEGSFVCSMSGMPLHGDASVGYWPARAVATTVGFWFAGAATAAAAAAASAGVVGCSIDDFAKNMPSSEFGDETNGGTGTIPDKPPSELLKLRVSSTWLRPFFRSAVAVLVSKSRSRPAFIPVVSKLAFTSSSQETKLEFPPRISLSLSETASVEVASVSASTDPKEGTEEGELSTSIAIDQLQRVVLIAKVSRRQWSPETQGVRDTLTRYRTFGRGCPFLL